MARHSKGILGVKKDPKKQILFSFGSRAGDEYPSDDSDSDYEPSVKEAEEVGLKPERKKRMKRSRRTETCERKEINLSEPKEQYAKGNVWGAKMPPEVLLIIFRHVVDTHGSLPFLTRASRVCSLWSRVSKQVSLWHTVDLSYGWIKRTPQFLTWLCNNRLSHVRHLNLNGWKKVLNNQLIEIVADHCTNLEGIEIPECGKVDQEGVKYLVDHCPKLSTLDFSSMNSKAVSSQSLCYVAEKCAKNLRRLDLSRNQLTGFTTVLNKLVEHCPNLEVLELNSCMVSTDSLVLNIEKLQAGWPKLSILRLANTKVMARQSSQKEQIESAGFPNLTELSLALNFDSASSGSGIDDTFLHRLLKNSNKLSLLDLRGCTHLTSTGLQSLHATDLQSLFISQSSIAKYDGIEIIMQKWQHSLQELDLSWNIYPGMSLDMAMRKLSDDPRRSKLEILNLNGTSISCSRIKSLLEGCPNLKSINLVSCRGLPRGMKREYTGQALDCLRQEIDSLVEKEDEENNTGRRRMDLDT